MPVCASAVHGWPGTPLRKLAKDPQSFGGGPLETFQHRHPRVDEAGGIAAGKVSLIFRLLPLLIFAVGFGLSILVSATVSQSQRSTA